MTTKKTKTNVRQQRSMRMQQIVGGVVAVIVILAMVLSLITNY